MVHFTCDLCGKELSAIRDSRYVVKIEIYPAFDPNKISEEDLDDDHLEAVSKLLERDPSLGTEQGQISDQHAFRYDLCPTCQEKYLRDPLGKEMTRLFDFSKN